MFYLFKKYLKNILIIWTKDEYTYHIAYKISFRSNIRHMRTMYKILLKKQI